MSFSIKKTIVDHHGRDWKYNDGWGYWDYFDGTECHSIGRSCNNKSKWQITEGSHAGYSEYKTLREAMWCVPMRQPQAQADN